MHPQSLALSRQTLSKMAAYSKVPPPPENKTHPQNDPLPKISPQDTQLQGQCSRAHSTHASSCHARYNFYEII